MKKDELIPVYRVSMVRDSAMMVERKSILTPEAAFEIIHQYFDKIDQDVENVVAFMVNTHNELSGIFPVATGTVNACPVDMKRVFKLALEVNCAGFILAHNHPSGKVAPSVEDLQMFRRARFLGEQMECFLLDAIIVAGGEFYSWRRASYEIR